MLTALVNKMDVNTVDVSDKVIECSKPLLNTIKVIVIGPVVQKLSLITQRDPLTPVFNGLGFRKARLFESLTEICNYVRWDRWCELSVQNDKCLSWQLTIRNSLGE